MGSIAGSSIKRIAIIGGGPSGIATAKFLLSERFFTDIQVFEQSDSIEGAWMHSAARDGDRCDVPQTNPFPPLESPIQNNHDRGGTLFTTPMYDHLETNIPHQLMGYANRPFRDGTPLYPSRQAVSKYLEEYAADIVDLIQFHTQVQDVHFSQAAGKDTWSLRSRNLHTDNEKIQMFDAVAVCSGHYNTPYIPAICGIEKWSQTYFDSIGHSKLYCSPEAFKGKKVVVVGNSASGMDIANQISQVSKHPLIISQRSVSWLSGSRSKSEEERITMKPQIAEFLDPSVRPRALRFSDGHVEENIDCILFCTGYLYTFPFLSSFLQELVHDGSRVHNIYQHMFYIDHPSLAFVALPIRVIPFPLAEVQAAVLGKVWSGQLALPPERQMREWELKTIKENGEGKKFLTLDGGKDFLYHNYLYDWANSVGFSSSLKPHRWTDQEFWLRGRFPDIKKAYAQRGEDRYNVKTPEELGFDYERTSALCT